MTELDEFLDNLFLGCAFKAYVEEARATGGSPCPIRTRQRAYRHYEEALAEKNGGTAAHSTKDAA